MLNLVWQAHSGNRYLVLIAGFLLAVASAVGLATGKVPPKPSRILGAVFTGLLDLQVLLGLVLLALNRFGGRVIGHLSLMLVATAWMHVLHVRARRNPDSMHFWRLWGAGGALALIVLGILSIGRGVFQSTALGAS